MLSRTFTAEEKSLPGFQASKDKLTLLIGANAPIWWLRGKAPACKAGDPGLTPGSERSPGGGNGNPLQYSCLEKPMDRGT